MLNCSGGRGGTGEVTGNGGEVGGGVGGGGCHGNPCLINWIPLWEKAYATPSSSPRGGEINGLYSRPFLPLLL